FRQSRRRPCQQAPLEPGRIRQGWWMLVLWRLAWDTAGLIPGSSESHAKSHIKAANARQRNDGRNRTFHGAAMLWSRLHSELDSSTSWKSDWCGGSAFASFCCEPVKRTSEPKPHWNHFESEVRRGARCIMIRTSDSGH